MIPIPAIHWISDLARYARALVARVRERQEPVISVQRGREVTVLLPVELYRKLAAGSQPRIVSSQLARPDDARRFEVTTAQCGLMSSTPKGSMPTGDRYSSSFT
jgi:prevent-host-death family protein